MNYRKTLLAASIITSLCVSGAVFAQDTTQSTTTDTTAQQQKDATQLNTVTVTGIRDTEAMSLNLKKSNASHVEIVTAEDIGKLPAKNVADTLQRLPGVNISSSSAAEGGFDEADRVSLRGTNPSLTQTLVNGHTIGTGDWFVLSQVQTVGRSVSYSLLPSEVVSQVVVQKTSEAKIVEGGAAGSVNIISRKPLEFAKNITAEASVGGVYSDLPGDTKPQFNGLFNWKNDANTVGLMVQGFYEERSLQRNGQEVVGGYVPVTTSTGQSAYAPEEIGSVLFTQQRKREGGVFDFQIKPADNLTLDLNGFYSKLKADNYNRNYMTWVGHALGGGGVLTANSIQNGVVTSGSIAGGTGESGVYDQISRPGASSESKYLTLDADWAVTDHLNLKGEVGTTRGTGKSPTQDVIELGINPGAGMSWNMNGAGKPIDYSIGGENSNISGINPSAGWIFGGQGITVKDKEDWGQIDGSLAFDDGLFSSLDFGVRYAKHERSNPFEVAQGPKGDWTNLANYPASSNNYPGDFGSSIGASVPNSIWYYTPAQLAAFNAQFANRDPVSRFYFNDVYSVKEKDSAAYVQLNFESGMVAGNVGLRYVGTKEDIGYTSTAFDPNANSSEGPISGSAFGDYFWNNYKKDYNKLLPSANLKISFTDDLVTRFAASQTMTRPDYSALAGTVSADDLTHTGSGGNPELAPLISSNFDAAVEWYFSPRGLLSAGVYAMNLNDYITFGNETRTFKDMQASAAAGTDVYNDYLISVPKNTNGKVRGVELNYIQPIGEHFGVNANYTYADGSASGDQPLQGTSKNTANLSGYFENDLFNARLSYTYRSEFFAGVSRTDNFYQSGIASLSASLGMKITDWMSVSFDAMNLNDPTLKYYTKNDTIGKQPHAFYVNGRQYYLNLNFKL